MLGTLLGRNPLVRGWSPESVTVLNAYPFVITCPALLLRLFWILPAVDVDVMLLLLLDVFRIVFLVVVLKS